MSDWQYLVRNIIEIADCGASTEPFNLRLEKGLDILGKDGWDLCAVKDDLFIFKRKD